MNVDEREQLTLFLEQLTQAPAITKDGEADALIRAACARQTDAAYLLVQRALLLETAVRNSQSEIARLQNALERVKNQSPTGNGFIDAKAWGNSPAPAMPPAAAPAASSPALANDWGSGMLGTMAGTVAGVVAGGFVFRGIGQLLGNQHSSSELASERNEPASAALATAAVVDTHDATDLFDTRSIDDYLASDADT